MWNCDKEMEVGKRSGKKVKTIGKAIYEVGKVEL